MLRAAAIQVLVACLGCVVLAAAPQLSAGLSQSQGAAATAPAAEPSAQDLERLSVAELLARMPADPRIRGEGGWSLEPSAAEIRRRIEGGLLSDEEWRAVLAAGDVIHTRSRWPVGEKLGLWIKEPPWMRRTKITLRAIDPVLGQVKADNTYISHCLNCRWGRLNSHRELRLARMPEGVTEVQCDVIVEQALPDENRRRSPTHQLWNGRFVIPVQSVAKLEDVFAPSSSLAESEAVRATLCAFLHGEEDGSAEGLRVRIGGEYASYRALEGLGIGTRTEVIYAGQLVGTRSTVLGDGIELSEPSEGLYGLSSVMELPPERAITGTRPQRWDLRITGTLREELLTLWEVDRWWNGSFTMPLAEAIEHGEQE